MSTFFKRLKLHLILHKTQIFSNRFRPPRENLDVLDVLLFPFLKYPSPSNESFRHIYVNVYDEFIKNFYNKYLSGFGDHITYCSNNFYNSLLTALINFHISVVPHIRIVKKLENVLHDNLVNELSVSHLNFSNIDHKQYIYNNILTTCNDFYDISFHRTREENVDPYFFINFNPIPFLQTHYPEILSIYRTNQKNQEICRYINQLTLHFGYIQFFLSVYDSNIVNHCKINDTQTEIERRIEKHFNNNSDDDDGEDDFYDDDDYYADINYDSNEPQKYLKRHLTPKDVDDRHPSVTSKVFRYGACPVFSESRQQHQQQPRHSRYSEKYQSRCNTYSQQQQAYNETDNNDTLMDTYNIAGCSNFGKNF